MANRFMRIENVKQLMKVSREFLKERFKISIEEHYTEQEFISIFKEIAQNVWNESLKSGETDLNAMNFKVISLIKERVLKDQSPVHVPVTQQTVPIEPPQQLQPQQLQLQPLQPLQPPQPQPQQPQPLQPQQLQPLQPQPQLSPGDLAKPNLAFLEQETNVLTPSLTDTEFMNKMRKVALEREAITDSSKTTDYIIINGWERNWFYYPLRSKFVWSGSIKYSSPILTLTTVLIPALLFKIPYVRLIIEGVGEKKVEIVLIAKNSFGDWVEYTPIESIVPFLSPPWTIKFIDPLGELLNLGSDDTKIIESNGSYTTINTDSLFCPKDSILIMSDSVEPIKTVVKGVSHSSIRNRLLLDLEDNSLSSGTILNLNRQVTLIFKF